MVKSRFTFDLMQIGTFTMAVKVILSYSKIIPYSDAADFLLIGLSLVCFVVKIVKQKYSFKGLIIFAIVGLVALYTSTIINDYSIVITVVTLFALRNYDFNKFIRTILKTEGWLCLFHILYSLLYSTLISREKFVVSANGRVRFGFGFGHPNVFSAILFCMIMMYIYLNYDNNLKGKLIATSIVEFTAYAFTYTRTSLITYLLFVFLIAIERMELGKKVIRYVTKFVIPCLSLIMYFLVQGYLKGNAIAYFANSIFTSRIKLGAYAFKDYGLTVFGQFVRYLDKITWDSKWGLNTFTFDNMYTYMIISVGIFWLVLVAVLFYAASKRYDSRMLIFMVSWALYGLSENTIINGYFCFPIFLIVGLFDSVSKSNSLAELKKNQEK